MKEIFGSMVGESKRRLLIGCLTLLVGVPTMGCCLLVLFTVVLPGLEPSTTSGGSSSMPIWLLIIGLLLLAGLIGVPVGIAVVTIFRRARAMDAVFNPLGFSGKAYMVYGRHYQGRYQARNTDVYIYRGPTVEVRLQSPVQTRVLINPKESISTSVAETFGKHPLTTTHSGLESFAIYPEEETWTLNWLNDSGVIESIQTLMRAGAEWAVIRRLEIQPGEIMLYLHRSHKMVSNLVDPSALQIWLDSLANLAQAAENQPAPLKVLQPQVDGARQSRQRMSKTLPYVIAFLVIGMPLIFIAIGLVAYLLVSLNQ